MEIAGHEHVASPDPTQSLAGLARLRFAGPLTTVTAPALRAQVRAAVRDGRTRMLIDLHAVTALERSVNTLRRFRGYNGLEKFVGHYLHGRLMQAFHV